ncbi:MAG TPA: efflux RND transporter periplasmic adaptor subunit [Candidatus Baltobacteraceae bacterium]|jgi:HlyD family secretion protein
MKRIRNLVLIVIGLVLVVAIVAFTGHRGKTVAMVHTETLKYGTFQTKLPENGVVQHPRAATVPTLVAGNIGSIFVKPGDVVQAGQLLATIDNPTLESNASSSGADLRQAQATINDAQINSQNQHVQYDAQVATALSNLREAMRVYNADLSLYKNKAIARNQVDADKAKLDQTRVAYDQAVQQQRIGAVTGYGQNSVQMARTAAQKAAIASQQAQQQVAFTRIVAPFSGIVQTVATQTGDPLTQLRPGDPVTAGQALFAVAAGDTFIVKAQVDEQDIINVSIGQQANITGQDFPGKTIVGHVASISPVAIKSTDASSTARQVLTTIHLNQAPAYLRDGMTVNVDILTSNIKNVLLVPNASIVKDKGKAYLWVVRGGVAHKVPVTTGKSGDTQTIIKTGVAAGDRFVPAPSAELKSGDKVQIEKSASPTPGAA